jgi:hypothetical protein
VENKPVSWSFLNQETGQSVDGLTFEQARFVTVMIDHKSRMAWLVWHDGLTDWMNLDECEQLIGSITKNRPHPPIPPNRPSSKRANKNQPLSGEHDMAQFLEFSHISKSEPKHDKRAFRRFQKNFRVDIVTHMGTFKVVTENISFGGMVFQTLLPRQVGKTFHATIVRHNGARLKVLCEQIRPPRGATEKSSRRVRFVKIEDSEVLNSWLVDQGLE